MSDLYATGEIDVIPVLFLLDPFDFPLQIFSRVFLQQYAHNLVMFCPFQGFPAMVAASAGIDAPPVLKVPMVSFGHGSSIFCAVSFGFVVFGLILGLTKRLPATIIF